MKKPLCTIDELPTNSRTMMEALLGVFARQLNIDQYMSHEEAVLALKDLIDSGLAQILLDDDDNVTLVAVVPNLYVQ